MRSVLDGRRPAPDLDEPVVSTRRIVWRNADRPTLFVETPASAAELLAIVPPHVHRVFMLGTIGDGTRAGARRWTYGAALPDGWTHGGHFLEDADSPVLRFELADRHPLTVLRCEAWWGDPRLTHEPYSLAEAETAWSLLRRLVADHFDGAGLNDTPGTTGRRAFARLIPPDVSWPCPPAAVAELLRSTSGQGRIELVSHEQLDELHEVDGRLMYAALLRELGTGLASWDDQPVYAGHAPGWYRVRVTVPADWSHVGILAAPADAGAWCWPAEPGQRFSAWATGAELHVAYAHGWHVDIRERVLFEPGKPLDGWQRAFIAAVERVERRRQLDDTQPWRLVRAGLRAILLHAIGAFHGRPRATTASVPLVDAGSVPKHAVDVRVEGDRLVWNEQRPAAWPEMVHPEWSVQVWGRARARLLLSPGSTGALRLPAHEVVAFRTDALYLRSRPDWSDDGKPGRFRHVASWWGPIGPLRSQTDLLALKRGA